MYVIVDKNDLKYAVAIAQRALPQVIIQEERGHLLLTLSDTLVVSATNNDYRAMVNVPVKEKEGEGQFTLDPKVLNKVLPKIDTDTVKIELNAVDLTVKVYTSEDGKSFLTMQSFPPDKMLTVSGDMIDGVGYTFKKKLLLAALNYGACYLPGEKEETKFYDQMVMDKGIVYAANGSNKMGFFVCKPFKQVKGLKLRKTLVSLLCKILPILKDETVEITETERTVGISADGLFFSCLKSNAEVPEIPVEHLKSEGPYTKISKNLLLKRLERVIASNPKKVGAGLNVKLEGAGEEAYIDLGLLASLDTNERVSCVRVSDDDTTNHKHVVGYTIFKSILSSLKAEDQVRLHINDTNKFFKVYEKGTLEGEDYIAAGLGAYSKVVQQ